jgi:hypothetical protein
MEHLACSVHFGACLGGYKTYSPKTTEKNQLVVTNDPVEVEDFKKTTDHSRESMEYTST